MARTTSGWVQEGEQYVRYHEQQGYLVKETYQPGRDAVLTQVAEERKADKSRFLGGHYIGSIPLNDIPTVRAKYPELFANCDQELKKKALIRFSNDPEMQPYIAQRA